MNHTLEEHRYFPIVAWTLVIGFALFVLHLTYTTAQTITSININVVEQSSVLTK